MKKTAVAFLFLLISGLTKSQTHKILDTDTDYLRYMRDSREPQNSYRFIFLLDFKDKLPDGNWIVYSDRELKKGLDSSKCILFTGTFKDSLREGTFMEYRDRDKKRKHNPTMVYTYRKGLLDGLYYSTYTHGMPMDKGYYSNGKQNGLFVSHIGKRETTEFFSNDSLVHCNVFVNNHTYRYYKDQYYTYTEYYDGDILKEKFVIENNKLREYIEYYDNGVIKRTIKPANKTLWLDDDLHFPNINTNELVGIVKNYDEYGREIKE